MTGNLDLLKSVQTHGGEITRYINETDANNSLLHYAIKGAKTETVDLLIIM
jgi:hypothetical protein